MKPSIFFPVLLSIAILFYSCSDDVTIKKNDPEEYDNIDLKTLKTQIVTQNNTFSYNIFKAMLQNDDPDENVFISPMSMYYALAMAYNGAEENTAAEFKNMLGWKNVSDTLILQSLYQLQNELVKQSDDITLTLANSIWCNDYFEPKQEFISTNMDYLNAEVYSLDFGLPTAVDEINAWIADQTNDKILNALDMIPDNALMYLINAIYFNATWKYQFADTSNTEARFYDVSGNFDSVTFMNQTETFDYISQDNYNAVKLPYSDSNYYMLVMLPHPSYSIDELTNDLDTVFWHNMQNSMVKNEVTISLPKFKFEYGTRNINEELQALGLNDAFIDDNANFTKITEERRIWISRVLHKSFIDVSEEGTEAAAVTIIEMVTDEAGGPETYNFTANRPFLFTICEESTDAILFMGRVMMPEYE